MSMLRPLLMTAAIGAAAAGAIGTDSGAVVPQNCASCLRLRGGGNVLSKLQEFLPRTQQRSGPKIIISGAAESGIKDAGRASDAAACAPGLPGGICVCIVGCPPFGCALSIRKRASREG